MARKRKPTKKIKKKAEVLYKALRLDMFNL